VIPKSTALRPLLELDVPWFRNSILYFALSKCDARRISPDPVPPCPPSSPPLPFRLAITQREIRRSRATDLLNSSLYEIISLPVLFAHFVKTVVSLDISSLRVFQTGQALTRSLQWSSGCCRLFTTSFVLHFFRNDPPAPFPLTSYPSANCPVFD